MTTRRRFIQTLAAIPPALSFRRVMAAPDASRLALIIGNSAYHDAPLVNPANDAKAVAGLFTQAGFTVDSHLNAKRGDMLAAIERFGTAAKRAETKLVVFYYAGHGAQLDWRNYLLPVDAVVEKQEHMKQRCVDLNQLLGQLSAAKDKTFVIILDACRNNPFGASYKPEQKGLSQFDAPVGSLLAYATSPGNVASDGEGANGLYTENLVRELGKRGTRIEDALKRVRLNVRLASKGEQIPWETTSLEGDVYIFNEGQKKLSEAEIEKQLEADVAAWTKIKSSKKADDWVNYLQAFPNGQFAEIAQMRLTRLLADVEKAKNQEREQQQARLAAEQKKAEEQRRQQREQQRIAEQKRLEQERDEREKLRQAEAQRLEKERLRIAEAERQAEEGRKQEEQRRLEEQKRVQQASEQKRLDRERAEREKLRLAEAQRLAAERTRLDEQQRQEKERQRMIEAEQLAEQKRVEQEKQERERREQEKLALAKPAPAQSTSPASAAASPAPKTSVPDAALALDIRAGIPVPTIIAPSANPFSAGRYPLGRIYTVGDRATVRLTDILTGVEVRTFSPLVTKVDYEEDRVEFNNGITITDLMGNAVKVGPAEYDTPVQFSPAEYQIGKKWTAAFRLKRNGKESNAYYHMHIVKRETIEVPAGRFDTFLIEGEGWNTTFGERLDVKLWMVPGINFGIKAEYMFRNKFGRHTRTDRNELIALRQHVIGLA